MFSSMSSLQRSLLFLKRRCLMRNVRAYSLASSNHPVNFTADDIGKMYKVDQNSIDILDINKHVQKLYGGQLKTFGECVWLCRSPLVEAINCIKNVSPSTPSFRLVLWGQFGTGKTLTLNQIVHYGHDENFVIVHIPSVMRWTRQTKRPDQQASEYKPGRLDLSNCSIELLQNFKHQNQPLWATLSDLKTEREYNWSKVEKTEAGRPLTEVVEMGLSAPFSANDCVGVLFKELRRYATNGSIKLMVAVDQANSLYGRTTLQRADYQKASADEISLILMTRKFIQSNWTNGVCVLVADKAEICDARDRLTIPLNTPLELFDDKGFDDIEPFIPIETTNYSKQEADAIYDYYLAMNWLTRAKVREARQQLFYLTGGNPFYYDRICAFT